MKASLWTALLLLCLCVPGRCDCQRDCLACGMLLSKQHTFSALVCLLECEDKVSPGLTWELCRQAAEKPQFTSRPVGGDVLKQGEEEDGEEVTLPVSLEKDGRLLFSEALQRFHHATQALSNDQLAPQRQMGPVGPSYGGQQLRVREEEGAEDMEGEDEEEQEEEEQEEALGAENEEAGLSLSKRFGGFLKGKHGYRKLMDPGRSLHKRYGGFIGIRKSARKWNNQKRFSEFLKQYLGMASHSSKYNSLSADFSRQNEV